MTKRVLGVLIAAGAIYVLTAWAQNLRSPQQLVVYDGDGKRVGVVVGTQQLGTTLAPLVAFKVDDVPFMLFAYRDALDGVNNVGWESTNCSGTPFLFTDSRPASTLPRSGVGVPGSTVYVEAGPPRNVNIRSIVYVPGRICVYPPLASTSLRSLPVPCDR